MPNPSVNAFLSNFQGGGARPNLYDVVITFPAIQNAIAAATKLNFTCRAAALPPSVMQPVDVPYMGRIVKIAGDRTFDDWVVRVFNDNDFIVKNTLEKWSNLINAHEGNIAAPGWTNPRNYLTHALVSQLDREGRIKKVYKMEGIFPVRVGEIQLGYDINNQVEEFDVVFAVNYWTSEDGDIR